MLPDASLGELHTLWPEIIRDLESVSDLMPEHVAESIAADFAAVRDELLRRDRITRQASQQCPNHDGSMLWLAPYEPPPDLLARQCFLA